MSIYWAVATGPNERTGRRHIFASTIRTTRRDAIRAYEECPALGDPGCYKADRKRWGVQAIKVEVREAAEAPHAR